MADIQNNYFLNNTTTIQWLRLESRTSSGSGTITGSMSVVAFPSLQLYLDFLSKNDIVLL
jgi:hypothetical protein